MANTSTSRSIAVIGHGAAGKTTLVEALLHAAGAISSKGSIDKGSTVCDFDPLEKEAGHSLASALAHCRGADGPLYFIDTPGYPDFAGQALAALAAVDTALLVINAQTGIELMSERMMRWADERKLCRMIVVNKIDADNLDLAALVAEIRERFGKACLLLDLPAHGASDVVEVLGHDAGDADFASVAAAHRALIDQLVEEDENLLARYLEDGADPKPEELHAPFEQAMRAGHLVPILFVSAKTGAGIRELLQVLAVLAPTPAEGNPPLFQRATADGEAQPYAAEPDPQKHVLAHVFKIVSDPYHGRVAVFRVHQGTLKKDAQLFIGDGKRPFKVTHLYRLQGKDFVEVEALLPGELGAVAKVEDIAFDAVLHDSHDEDRIFLKPLEFPRPMAGLAVETRKKGDEQRLFDVLAKLAAEDPTFVVERHPATNETVIRGLGEIHLKAKFDRMASQYKLDLETRPPLIPYRETIAGHGEGHCRHKKQSGGAGQFGEVALRIEPLARGEGRVFVDAVKGGAIPGSFMAAVEKGVRQVLHGGAIAGYPIQDVRVTVYDGKHHAVDSKEVAFVTAGKKAVQAAIRDARPTVLEPIARIAITAPDSATGALTGDLSSRRGIVSGTDSPRPGQVAITAQVPLAELSSYQMRLDALTAGQGAYTLALSHYEVVPPQVQQQLAGQYRVKEEE